MDPVFTVITIRELAEADLLGKASTAIKNKKATHEPCMNPPMIKRGIKIIVLETRSAAIVATVENKLNKIYALCTVIFLRINGLQKRIISDPVKKVVSILPDVLKSIPFSK